MIPSDISVNKLLYFRRKKSKIEEEREMKKEGRRGRRKREGKREEEETGRGSLFKEILCEKSPNIGRCMDT